jgi:hypothetical protein
MNPYITQSLVQDHIRESRQQAAAARRASAARASQRRPGNDTARRSGRHVVRGA